MRGNVCRSVNCRLGVVAGLGFIPLVAWACTGAPERDGATVTTSAMGISPEVSSESVRTLLLAEATGNYTYGASRQPISQGPQSPANFPAMTIASAVRTDNANRPPESRFLGRITSSGPYPSLAIAPGQNYIWTDSVAAWSADSGPSRVLIVPANTAYPMVWLRNDSVHSRMTSSPDPEPLLRMTAVKVEACSDGCTSGHCSNSTTRRNYDSTVDNPRLRITDDS